MSKLFDTLVAGGITMIPLLICSFVVVAFSIERSIFWFRIRKHQGRLVRTLLLLFQDDPIGVNLLLEKHRDNPVARIFEHAISIPAATPTEFALALDAGTQAEIPRLKSFNNIFEISVGLGPLLGLLGTVTGLITTFSSLKIGDASGSKALEVTGGISEALISTAAGLIVAVGALLAGNTFKTLFNSQVAFLDQFCTQLELLYLKSLRQQTGVQEESHV